jgi:predicted ATPase/DNA-binding SARP family transcriptional activator
VAARAARGAVTPEHAPAEGTVLRLLGAPTIEHAGVQVALPNERRSQLLVHLALARDWAGRAELAALLWPDLPDKLAYTNLRKALFRLQAAPWAPAVESRGGALRLRLGTDVEAFESALRDGRAADALAAWRGEPLDGFDDDANEAWTTWLRTERDRLRGAWRGAALAHLGGPIDAAEAIALSARLLAADPLDEAALRAHMDALARAGQGAQARRAYREFTERLERELGLPAGAELREAHDTLVARGASAASTMPAAGGAAAPARRDDGFVGRSAELRRLADLLADDACLLVCITGPGGIGKTRLARRALQANGGAFADGAVFVALDDLTSAQEVGARLARELGLALAARGQALAQVIDALRERRTLLVLDNLEQFGADTGFVDLLLEGAPRVKIVATSRERIASPAAWLLPLEGLPCPEPDDADRIESFDAARLFVAAARRVEPALVPGAEAAAIAEICRRVDGLPLALELAAAWTRVLSCAAIAAELRQGVALLQAADATRPARHAGIEVVFEQSWRLLSAAERDALARLSVFRGGFTPEAARAVAGAPLAVLGALADKSLLRREGARMHLHALVQQLASARLSDEARAQVQGAHARHFHHVLAQARRQAENGDGATLRLLDDDFENCRDAWRWTADHGPVELLKASATCLLNHADYRGRPGDGLALLLEAADAPRVQADATLHARLLSKAAHLQYRMGRYAGAQALATRALAAMGRPHDRETRLQVTIVLASCALQLGRLADARRIYKQALRLAAPEAREHDRAALLDNLALVEKRLGHYDAALQLALESLAQHRRIGDSAGFALCLNNLGSLHLARQDAAAALGPLREGLSICERDGLAGTRGFVLANLAVASLRIGDLDAAADYTRRGIDCAQISGNRSVLAWMHEQAARLAMRQGRPDAARAALAAAATLALDTGAATLKVGALQVFGEILHAQGEADAARRLLDCAARHPLTSAPERDELHAQLARWGGPPAPARSAIDLDELVRRIADEAEVGHAPLTALLRET